MFVDVAIIIVVDDDEVVVVVTEVGRVEAVGDFGFLSSLLIDSLRLRTRSNKESFCVSFFFGDLSLSNLVRRFSDTA